VLLAVFALLLRPVMPLFTAPGSAAAPAFQQLLPALFGALLAGYLRKYWRVAFAPVLAGVIALIFAPTLEVGVIIPITVIVSLVCAQAMWMVEAKKAKKKEEEAS
jgi:predicted membrane protein